MGLLDRLATEWPLISRAPLSFIIVAAIVGISIWALLRWRYGGIIENLNERLKTRAESLEEYRRKLEGASPDEIRDRIDDLERRVLAAKGRTLTGEQAQKLTDAMKQATIQTARVNWFGSGGEERRYATQIAEAIKAAGISVEMSAMTAFMNYASGVIVFEDDRGDFRAAAAVFNELGIRHLVSKREHGSTPGLFILVGEREE